MNKKSTFYITTTLPYVNEKPHIGSALEIVQADTTARIHRMLGKDVFFNFGTDEHGQKILHKAQEEGVSPQDLADKLSVAFDLLRGALDLSYDTFVRTTSDSHKNAAQEMWRLCLASGDIYKKNYKTKYCVGCELEKTDSELDSNGKCPLHPNRDLEILDEENYFFAFSRYTDPLLELWRDKSFLVPDFRLNELRTLVRDHGLQDFSVSRLAKKMPWGVPVPDDPDHVMYVWFDALTNYISTLGWPHDMENFKKFWTGEKNCIQFAGKDQVRQQAAMWQAMLMSAGMPPTGQIFIHGFINIDGQKISKSLGNVIDPIELSGKYGGDAVRYYLLRHVHPFEDSDMNLEKFHEAYHSHLVNGLGNLVSRIMTLSCQYCEPVLCDDIQLDAGFIKALSEYRFDNAMDIIWGKVGALDTQVSNDEPFKVVKTDPAAGQKMINDAILKLDSIAQYLLPVMPSTSIRIRRLIQENQKPESQIFPRIEL